ncbi:MAG: two-component regulator propeller domain-containing protein [Bacteroidales bacterium]
MKHTLKTSSLFLMLVGCLSASGSQPPYFLQISSKDGLSQNTVRSIHSDEKGFIWAGTLDGLNRYDGHNIITYKPQLGIANSLIDHRVKDLFQSKSGHLWVKTYDNLFSCYDPQSNSFVSFTSKSNNKFSQKYPNYLETSNGDVWLWGEHNGCLRIRVRDNTFETLNPLKNEELGDFGSCSFLFEDSQHAIWIGANSKVYRQQDNHLEEIIADSLHITQAVECHGKIYFIASSAIFTYNISTGEYDHIAFKPSEGNFTSVVKQDKDYLLLVRENSGVYAYSTANKTLSKPDWAKDEQLLGEINFIKDKNKGIWMYNHSGIMWYYNQNKKVVKKMELIPPEIANMIDLERYNVFIDSEDLIWITTYGNGLFSYEPDTEQLHNYKYTPEKNSPASDYLLDITEDHYGNIWIGSEYAGIIKVVKSNYDRQFIRPEVNTSIGKNNNVRSIFIDSEQNIWVGTKNGSLYKYQSDLSGKQLIKEGINPYAMEEVDNKLWIGTKGQGLYVMNKNNDKVVFHCQNEIGGNALTHNTIFSILKDKSGRMWLGTFGGGINLIDSTNNELLFRSFFNGEGNRSYIRDLHQDSTGQIWAATSDGLLCFYPNSLLEDSRNYVSYKMDLTRSNGLLCNDIKTIFEDKDGAIWIGTAGGGISKYVGKEASGKGLFKNYTAEDGLAGDAVTGIMQDEDGNLWISTESGISKLNMNKNFFITYNFSEKTYGNHFNENAGAYSQNGNMMWGSLDGMLVFNPKTFEPDTITAPTTLTNFFILNQKMNAGEIGSPLHKSISYSSVIRLPYNQNTFTIEFASLNLKHPLKNKYSYRLDGYEEAWSAENNSNSATYKNLSPGKYTFEVKGTNSDGLWGDKITQLDIRISPPLWLTGYAYLLYAILLVLAIYITLKIIYKFNSLRNNIKLEHQLTNFKLRFFTNISHEFRTPLTLIRGAVENLNEQLSLPGIVKKQVDILSRNSSNLTRLIDQLLEFRKLENNVLRLDLEKTDIVKFAHEIFDNFSELARKNGMDYQFKTNEETYECFIDQSKLEKVIYNLLSNAFKFTPNEGQIILHVETMENKLIIGIKDNGAGIPKNKQNMLFSRFMQINFSSSGTGVGLSLVKEFVEVHKGHIWYEENYPKGSIFKISIPTDETSYEGENFIKKSRQETLARSEDKQDEESIIAAIPEVFISNADKKFQLLIIDDNDDIRDFLQEEFSKYFRVELAENGKEGLEKASEISPDLIICDVMMPEMDGFELTRQLKAEFSTSHIPIVMLTAHSSIEHQLEGIESGADAYIMKPFSLKYLSTRVFKLIDHREQLKKRFSNEYVLDGTFITSTEQDQNFCHLLDIILEKHLPDSQFSVDKFSELAKLKRTIFYKKVKGITGQSPNELIKMKRMKKAAELILQGGMTVSEVAYAVGFEDPFYFSKCFKAQYKCSPSKYGKKS